MVKTIRGLILLILLSIFLSSCGSEIPVVETELPTSILPERTPTHTPEPELVAWWKDIVFYEIFVRSFYDSDVDGVGDFQGIIQQLDTVLVLFLDNTFSTFLYNHDQHRVMSLYEGHIDKAKSGAFIYLTGPGVPFIYYGEEIGMFGNKPDELLRMPMP